MAPRNPAANTLTDGNASMLLDDQLCFALYSATHAIQRLYRPLLDDLGLTYPQYLVLLVLWEQDGLSVTDIGDRLTLNSATLTPLLKRMEAADILKRVRSDNDGRRVTVSLQSKGKRLKKRVGKVTTEVTCAAVDASNDAVALRDELVTLRSQLPDSP